MRAACPAVAARGVQDIARGRTYRLAPKLLSRQDEAGWRSDRRRDGRAAATGCKASGRGRAFVNDDVRSRE